MPTKTGVVSSSKQSCKTYLDILKNLLNEIFVLSINDQQIKVRTGSWYLKLTPTVPFNAPVRIPAIKIKIRYLLDSL